MGINGRVAALLASSLALAWPAVARQAPAGATAGPGTSPAPEAPGSTGQSDEPDEIVVIGQRALRGAVVGDIAPEKVIGPAEIRSYGVSSIADLLDELTPQTASGRGRGGDAPVLLLNGRRISSFADIRDIPTEAIERVDILPEEVALKYGYRADQRVVNFVLRSFFRAVTTEANDRLATQGGTSTPGGDVNLLHIRRNRRLNLDLNASRTGSILESERAIREAQGGVPYDLIGNVTGVNGGEIDPALSALAGGPLAVAGVPAGLASPTLADFAATPPHVTDQTAYRTLQSASRSIVGNAVFATPLLAGINGSFNARVSATESHALQGLPGTSLRLPADNAASPFGSGARVDRLFDDRGPLSQTVHGVNSHLGMTLDRDLRDWRLSLTGTFDRTQSTTRTDRGIDPVLVDDALAAGDPSVNPFGAIPSLLLPDLARDHAHSVSNSGGLDLLVNGPLATLPAGPLSASFRAGASASRLDAESTRAGLFSSGSTNREIGNGQLNLDLPIASRRKGVLPWLGELSLNGNVALDHLSDFGTLPTLGYGLHWSPLSFVDVIASVTDEKGAPTANQLGDPSVLTPNVRVYDYASGTTVDVTAIAGGNAALSADHRKVMKLGLTVRPPLKTGDLTLGANYTHSRLKDAISAFPTPTTAIEAAFADRFVRDGNGQLAEIDERPVNFARETRAQLRWGFDFSYPLVSRQQRAFQAWTQARREGRDAGLPPKDGPASGSRSGAGAPGEGASPPRGGGGPGGGGWRGGGGGGGRGGTRASGGRLQFAVYHSWYFRDDILIRPGVPVLDLLNGAATGETGGQSRHQIDVQAGIFQNGLGARLSATWRSATTVDAAENATLRFHAFTSTSLRLFADFGQQPTLVRAHPWVRGMRLTFSVDNLLDKRLRVTDAAGDTPVRYQPDFIDPLGRTVRISLRKLFFTAPSRPR